MCACVGGVLINNTTIIQQPTQLVKLSRSVYYVTLAFVSSRMTSGWSLDSQDITTNYLIARMIISIYINITDS